LHQNTEAFMRFLLFCCISFFLLTGCEYFQPNQKAEEPEPELVPEPQLSEVGASSLRPYSFSTSVEAPGVLEAPLRIVLYAQDGGVVTEVYKTMGDYVVEGQVLADLENPGLSYEVKALKTAVEQLRTRIASSQSLNDQAVAGERLKKRQFDRLSRSYGSSEETTVEALDQAEAEWKTAQAESSLLNIENQHLASELKALEEQLSLLEKREEALAIKAPFNGYISRVYVRPGMLVRRPFGDSLTTAIAELVDLNKFRMEVAFPAPLIQSIPEGTDMEVEVEGYAQKIDARVESKGIIIDPITQQFPVVVRLEPRDSTLSLRPGMRAKAQTQQAFRWEELAAPLSAVMDLYDNPYVWTVEEGILRKHPVVTGYNDETFIAVRGDDIEKGLWVVERPDSTLVEGLEVKLR
jgi:RND family efflux transporter MFP subunit